MSTEGWSSPWAERVERRPAGVLDALLERQEVARGRAYRRRRVAGGLALTALLGLVLTPFVPYGWVPFLIGVAAASRAAWLWTISAGDAYEGSLDLREVLVDANVD